MRIGAAAKAAFVSALADGLRLGAAAEAAGHALASFYLHRARDPGFAEAWEEAAASSAKWANRRLRLTPERASAYLESFARECNTTAAAAAAGVHRATVYRRIAGDPAFARAHSAALEQGYASLEIEAALEREAQAEEWRRREPADVGARPTQDFDEQMKLLARYTRRAPRRDSRPRRRALSREEAIEDLMVKLDRMGARLELNPSQ